LLKLKLVTAGIDAIKEEVLVLDLRLRFSQNFLPSSFLIYLLKQ